MRTSDAVEWADQSLTFGQTPEIVVWRSVVVDRRDALVDLRRKAEVYDRIAEILAEQSCADYTAHTHRRIDALFPEVAS